MMNLVKNFWNEQDGGVGVEYLVLIGIIAIGMIAVVGATFGVISTEWGKLDSNIENQIVDKDWTT